MSRTILDLMIKVIHLKPYLINYPLDLRKEIEEGVGHRINHKSFIEKYNLLHKNKIKTKSI